MDQVSSTNDDRAWMEKYCDTVVTKSEAEWRRQGPEAGSRDASADPAETESHNSVSPDAATNEAAEIAEEERHREARKQKAEKMEEQRQDVLKRRDAETRRVAKQVITSCQASLDAADLPNAIAQWHAHLDALGADAALGGTTDIDPHDLVDVEGCLANAGRALTELQSCVIAQEGTDDEILSKQSCIDAYLNARTTCGPLDVTKLRAEQERNIDLATIKTRVDAKAAPIKARQARCLGTNVLQIVVAVQTGRDVNAHTLDGCTYDVAPGVVENTTRDGWMVVRWGEGTVAAFKSKSRKQRADGSYLRTTAKASYIGLGSFDQTDGGSAKVATFTLAE
jgi:hypothetical protein